MAICNEIYTDEPFYQVSKKTYLTHYGLLVFPRAGPCSVLDLVVNARKRQRELSHDLHRYLIACIVRILHFMHCELGYAHCDFKLDNLMITDDFSVCAIDFAHLHKLDAQVTTNVGTLCYNPPEAIRI